MTVERMRKAGHDWPSLRELVRLFVKRCPCCQKMNALKHVIAATPFTTASYEPMVRVSMDTIGPLPATKEGLQYILVMIDNFTRFVELYATKDTSAQDAAPCVVSFIGRYGVPQELLSDNGTQFKNELIGHVTKALGTTQRFTMPDSKEENAIVERANKEVNRHLRNLVYHHNIIDMWADYLPLVQRIINASTHSSIGMSPAQLLFGNAVNLDRGLFLPKGEVVGEAEGQVSEKRLSEWVDRMLSKQAVLLQVASQLQRDKDSAHMQECTIPVTTFAPNSYVLVRHPVRSMNQGRPTKLHGYWKGPLRVVSNEHNTYHLHNLVTDKVEKCHVTSLKPFLFSAEFTDPKLEAYKDKQLFLVESISSHAGNTAKKSTMDFKVKWVGLGEEYDLWLPWKELRDNVKLHEYLRAQGLSRLLAKEHR